MKVVWAPIALERVREQARYIGEDNPSAARKWIENIFASAKRLGVFPESGRVVPELQNRAVRELLTEGYRIIYRIEDEQISIMTVRHGRRELSEDDIEV